MTLEEFLDRIDDIMCGTSNAERAYLADLYDEVTKPHWISVEDELPPLNQDVFVAFPINQGYARAIDRMIQNIEDNGYVDWELITGITHWLPLPQLPVLSNSGNTGKKGGAQ